MDANGFHRLIVKDRTTQNTLAVFIGAYVYALIAISSCGANWGVDTMRSFVLVHHETVIACVIVQPDRGVLHLHLGT